MLHRHLCRANFNVSGLLHGQVRASSPLKNKPMLCWYLYETKYTKLPLADRLVQLSGRKNLG